MFEFLLCILSLLFNSLVTFPIHFKIVTHITCIDLFFDRNDGGVPYLYFIYKEKYVQVTRPQAYEKREEIIEITQPNI